MLFRRKKLSFIFCVLIICTISYLSQGLFTTFKNSFGKTCPECYRVIPRNSFQFELYSSEINQVDLYNNTGLPVQSMKKVSTKTFHPTMPKLASALPRRKDNIFEKLLIFLLSYFLLKLLPCFKNSSYYLRDKTSKFCYLGMEYDGFVNMTKVVSFDFYYYLLLTLI